MANGEHIGQPRGQLADGQLSPTWEDGPRRYRILMDDGKVVITAAIVEIASAMARADIADLIDRICSGRT